MCRSPPAPTAHASRRTSTSATPTGSSPVARQESPYLTGHLTPTPWPLISSGSKCGWSTNTSEAR
jgi:hypothetical protein